ncbi:MAG: M20/M25/M40 family metallo-hydrolase [Deltaproteobacteria bacterium]|nr:MAG: M20/M25/M40 family metallo-hydrolase [Deltaproteobacteria bacterium]
MKRLYSAILFLLTLTLSPDCLEAHELVRHHLRIMLYPDENRLVAEDTITVPAGLVKGARFLLHEGLNPSSPTPGVEIARETRMTGDVPVESFKIRLPPGKNAFVLRYGGKIHHPLEGYGKERARGFRRTSGIIAGNGVYLAGSSSWYPRFSESLVTFTLRVELPGNWDAVGQGSRTLHVRNEDQTLVQWESPEPQEGIFVVAAPFVEYTQAAGRVEAMVFLRAPDEELADKYLDATVRYLALYEKLIGPYPYKKFALVENFWETGFGMPSFTLLGSKIIRFPFILYSSYPHEILHNWWGNSVFPDYNRGNWAEGLTAYLSDHLLKEMRGNGGEYRQQTLQKYADYVLKERDFPLTQFLSRHSSSSEAVGYGKSLMFFHMLRQELGDETFVRGLQEFFKTHKFKLASFEDLGKSFEAVSGKELGDYLGQWLTRAGAPALKVSRAEARIEGDGYVLTGLLEQVQSESPYRLRIPVAITMEGQAQTHQTVVVMEKRKRRLELNLPARPLRLDVDPEFDVFRRLDRDEIPPALTQAFGARKMLILLPSRAERGQLRGYWKLAEALGQSGPGEVEVKLDTQVDQLPSERGVILLGWDNLFLSEILSALSEYDLTIRDNIVSIDSTQIPRDNHSVVLTARQPKSKDLSLMWVASDVLEALPGLGRKLPHYHKYSYLAFRGQEPTIVTKGRWPVRSSPMTVFLPHENGTISGVERGRLASREPLATLPPVFSTKRMMETVRILSNDALRGRGFGTEGLDRAAEFIAARFRQAGLKPAGDASGNYFQTWEDMGGDPERRVTMRNVVGVIPAKNGEHEAQSVVVGAHYDHLGLGWPDVRQQNRGKIHHGADDNGSGVAVLIELARVLGESPKPHRSVVFVAFTGEEAGRKGSRYYVAHQQRYPLEQCVGMLNLDTVGRLGKNKLLVLGTGSAREWMHIFRGVGFATGVQVETVSEELDSSDQRSFQEAGIPAVQLFTGPHSDYHRPSDTVDRIDAEGLAKVAAIAKEVVEYLAGREEPMTSSLTPGREVESTTKRKRNVSLGTIPDFAYRGHGFRLSGVVPGSPAESSGLKEGDVIVRIDADAVSSLQDFSNILKALKPGDRISITFMRAGRKTTVEATLKAR